MKLTIEIDLDNAAFEDNGVNEVERILTDLCERLPTAPQYGETHKDSGYMLHDSNGNYVGEAHIR